MEQTEKQEIIKAYKESKNKLQQIKILADLHVCTQKDIKDVLTEAGIDIEKRPYVRKAEVVTVNGKPQKVMASMPAEEKPKTAKKAIPAAVDEALRDKIKALQAINAISQQRIDEQMEIISKNNESIKQIRAYLTMEG